MKGEVRKILEMLENGKINAEQAEKLINALYGEKGRDEKKRNFESAMEDFILGVISSAFEAVSEGLKLAPLIPSEISEAFSEVSRGLKEDFKNLGRDFYIVKITSGDVEVSTSPDSRLKPGEYREKRLILPENSKLALKVADGDTKLTGKFDEVICIVVDGDLEFKGWFNILDLHMIDGDATVETDIMDLKESVKVIDGEKDIPELHGGDREIRGRIIDGDLKIISSDSSR